MNYLQEFKGFYLKTVLPNNQSYFSSFNENNFDKNIKELIKFFEDSYGTDPFLINSSSEIKKIFLEKKEPFTSYSLNKGSDIPQSIINKHFSLFLDYNKTIYFSGLQDYINKLHEIFGQNFIKKFQRERIKFNGKSKLASSSEIFGQVRNDVWTINKGSEKELQYHIYKHENKIGYGFGFNAQKSQNNLNPLDHVVPFVASFLLNKNEIDLILNDYSLSNNTIDDLKNIREGDFILYGKSIKIESTSAGFKTHGLKFLEMFYDLKNKQFKSYKYIYENSKKTANNSTQIFFMLESKNILNYKKQIILQGPPGTGKTKFAKEIAVEMLGLTTVDDLEENEQFKLIQFHPSYTYEDFVRGIVAQSTGDYLEYNAINRIFGDFTEKALKNFNLSSQNYSNANLDLWIDEKFDLLKKDIEARLPEEETFLSGDISIYDVTKNSFKYGRNWKTTSHIKFGEFKKLIKAVISGELQISNKQMDKNLFVHAHYRYTYYNSLLDIFFKEYPFDGRLTEVRAENYILIIDEINRANLSSVLGELIYALEYRGKAVSSIYGLKDENNEENFDIIIPPNLFIIGTMNTADRSVGYIDYAIRRRFAFIDILPRDLSKQEKKFDSQLFEQVKDLFTTDDYQTRSVYLSSEFEPKDVALGHSYFIDKSSEGGTIALRLKYEIKPILLEYIKDGILKESAREIINQLSSNKVNA